MDIITIVLGIIAVSIAVSLAAFVAKILFRALSGALSGAFGCGILGATAAIVASLVGVEAVSLGSVVAHSVGAGAILGAISVLVPEKMLKSISRNRSYGSATTVSTYGYKSLPELEAPEGYVYVIKDKDRPGMYKIGRTKNPKRRLQQISSNTGSDLEYIRLIRTTDAQRHEKRLHRRYSHSRRAGEWFKLLDSEANNIY